MKKLLICLSLILVLVMVFVACKKDDQTPDDTTTQKQETPPPTECDHQYGEWTADASVECADENRLYRVCSKCGEKETKADECAFGEWVKAEGKVCADADRMSKTCSKCGKIEYSNDGACTYGQFVDVVVATCEEDGLKEAACTKCGDKVEIEVKALGHKAADGTAWKVLTPATCTTDGIVFGTCGNCKITGEFTAPAFGHSPIAAATCTEDSICGTCNEVVVQATGHSYIDVAAKEVSCTEDGYVAGTVCTVCGDTNGTDYALIPALGHKYTWTVTVEPTFAAEGAATAACARCDATDTTVVPMKKPELLYTPADFAVEKDAKDATVKLDGVTAVKAEDGSYVTLTAKNVGAYIEFLADKAFSDVISIKYRASDKLVDFGGNRDGYFELNGTKFFGSVLGDNVIDYNNEATVGEWAVLNIDLRKSQGDLNGVEYDILNGAAIDTIKYILFAGYEEGASIDVAYIAFFENKTEALEYASVNGEYATPHVYVDTLKATTTTLDNTNGTGEYGAPGKFLNTNENKGVTVINWNGRFYNSYKLSVAGTITVEGGVESFLYSFDGGMTWLEFADGDIDFTPDENKVSYTAKFDLSGFAGQTADIRIAAVLSHDETTNVTELAHVLNIKKIEVKTVELDSLDVNFLATAGNQADKTNVTATVVDDYVHFSMAAGDKKPAITLYSNNDGAITLKKYMLIQYRGNGNGYGDNYDFFLDINGKSNVGGLGNRNADDDGYDCVKRENWFNLVLDNTWNYIIIDLTNGGLLDISAVETLEWVLFDNKNIAEAKGNWLDIKEVKFFDTYAEARDVANPNGEFISTMENGNTVTGYTYMFHGASNLNLSNPDEYRTPKTTGTLDSVTMLNTDTAYTFVIKLTSNVTVPQANVGIKVDGYDIAWAYGLNDTGHFVKFAFPGDFALGSHNATVVVKSPTNGEIIALDEFVLTVDTVGITLADADGRYPINDANIAVTPATAGEDDVVALYYGNDLVMYYTANSAVTGFKANGGNGITINNTDLAKLAAAGTYTLKLHADSIDGTVIATKDIVLADAGIVGGGQWTAAELYEVWKNVSPSLSTTEARYGLKAELLDDGNGQYVRFTATGTWNASIAALHVLFGGSQFCNIGWTPANSANGYLTIKYRNNTNLNYLYLDYTGGYTGRKGYIGTVNDGWSIMNVNSGWGTAPAGMTSLYIAFPVGMVIDIESLVFLNGYQAVDGAYDSLYGFNHN